MAFRLFDPRINISRSNRTSRSEASGVTRIAPSAATATSRRSASSARKVFFGERTASACELRAVGPDRFLLLLDFRFLCVMR